jgi:hypothetical protein
MASAEYVEMAQEFYVAYYGRPGDPSGVEYWADRFETSTNLDAALDAFGASDEFTDSFGSLTNEQLVENIYQQTFSRSADAEGLAFYVDLLDSGEATLASIAKQIVDGATGSDVTVLANKVAVAQVYTDKVTELDATYTSDDIADAQAILAAVDDTTSSVTAGALAAEADVEANAAVAGETFTLTTSTDSVVATAGDDTITGTTSNLSTADRIIDASTTDNDTFNLTATADPVAMDVTNVENINIDWDAFGTPDVDLDNVTGATVTLSSVKEGYLGNANFVNVGTNNISLTDGIVGDVNIGAAEDITIVADNAENVVVGNGGGAGSNTENADGTIDISANAADSVIVNGADDLTLSATAATSVDAGATATADITVGVDGDLTLDTATAEVTLQSTADVALDIQAGAAFDTLTLAGDNAVTLDFANAADLAGQEVINGGAIIVADEIAATNDFEDVEHTSITLEDDLEDSTSANAAMTVATGANIILEADMSDTNFYTTTFETSTANDASSDSITVTSEADQSGALIFDTTDQDFETVNIVADSETAVTGTDITFAEINAGTGTVNLTSTANDVEFTDVEASKVNATAAAGAFVMASDDNADMEIQGAAGDNDVTFTGAASNEVTVIGQDGDDSVAVVTTDGVASAVLGEGDNSVTATGVLVTGGQLSVTAGSGNDDVTADAATTGDLYASLGDGTNTFSAAGLTTGEAVYVGGAGDDTVTATSLTTGTVNLTLGDGDNSVTLDGTFAGVDVDATAGTGDDTLALDADTTSTDNINFDFGTGTNTLDLSSDITAGTLTFTGLDVIDINSDAGTAIVDGALLNGASYTLKGDGTQTDQLQVQIDATAATDFDFSSLQIDNTVTDAMGGLTIDDANDTDSTYVLTGGADTITAGAGDNTITGGAGADIIDGEGGDDVYVINGMSDLVTQAKVAAVVADTDGDAGSSTTEEMTNADSYDIIGWVDGDDTFDLSAFDADATTSGVQAWEFGTVDSTVVAGTSDAIDVTGTAGEVDFQIGTFDATNGDFTHDAGNDALMILNDGENVGVVVVIGGATIAEADFTFA